MAKIFMCGDVHSEFGPVKRAAREKRPDAIVLLGDLEAARPLEQELAPILDRTEVWFIHGNHDTDQEVTYRNLFGSTLANHNLHGRIVEIAGIRVAGLGGVFRGEIWYPADEPEYMSFEEYRQAMARKRQPKFRSTVEQGIYQSRERRHRSSIFYEDYFALHGERADVLVTHEAPSCHPRGFFAIDELARSMGVKQLFHGHHHDCLDYSGHFEELGFRAYGVGLRGITALDTAHEPWSVSVVVPGEIDDTRAYRQREVDYWPDSERGGDDR